MQDNVNLLDDDFKREMQECFKEAQALREKETELKRMRELFNLKREARIKLITEEREKKLALIESEVDKCREKIRGLKGHDVDVMQQYIEYLLSLRSSLCNIFGHDIKQVPGLDVYFCGCCRKLIFQKDFHDGQINPQNEYLTKENDSLDLELPSFQKKLK